MLFSRTNAFIVAFALVLLLSFGGIALMLGVGTNMTHGHRMEHSAGVVIQMDTNGNMVLLTASGAHEQFRCAQRCLMEKDHIVRHIRERAHTDVYYMEMPDKTLMAMDVD